LVKADQSAALSEVVLSRIYVDTAWVVDGGVVFDNSYDLSAILLEELSGPISDCAETLHYNSLACDTLALSLE
jgi:hypothetical protein